MVRLAAIVSKVRDWLLTAELWDLQLPREAANRYRREQIRGTIEQMRALLSANVVFAPLLAYQAWPSGEYTMIIAWTVLMLSCSMGILWDWTRLYQTTGKPADMVRFKSQAIFDATGWCLGMILFYPLVQGDQKTIMMAIVTGVLALGTLGWSGSVVAGLIFVTFVAIGTSSTALLWGLTAGTTVDLFLAVLGVFAALALGNSVIERGRASLMAFRNHEALSQKTEVIALLLKDYEARSNEWFWQTDAHSRIIVAPDYFLRLLGLAGQIDQEVDLYAHVKALCTADSTEGIASLGQALRDLEPFHDILLSVKDPETGNLCWLSVKGRPRMENGEFLGYQGLITDATATVEAERRVNYLAAFDSLTDLLNRNSVQRRLTDLDPDQDIATAYLIDLDGFKQINDSYGHDIGDALLCAAANRLRFLAGSQAWAARLAGDEFFMMAPGTSPGGTTIEAFGQEICDRLSEPFKIESFELQISASVGIARFPQDTNQGPELLSHSDLALYDAKGAGRNRANLFDQSMLDKLNERVAVIERLREAVRKGVVRPHYQSQHSLIDGRVVGFEALARWFDPELGVVGPDVFIPIAEQTGMIVPLGEQLMRAACADAARWAQILGDDAPTLSVNISPVQFARSDVAEMLCSVLADTGLPAHLISIEVTEGVLISDKARVAETLREVSEMGVSIALDDFGTGYSSLSYLQELPLDRLKIDRAFVQDLEDNPVSPIVSTVIQLGHNLGMNVIAEGVETERQVQRLSALGCDDGQGYHFSRPMPADKTDAYIAELARSLDGSDRKAAS